MCIIRSLGRDTDAGVAAIVRATEEADGEDFERATMLLDAATGKHWRALSASMGDVAWLDLPPAAQEELAALRSLYVHLRDGRLCYDRVGETQIKEVYGSTTSGEEAVGKAKARMLSAATPIHEWELQLASATSHGSGDHCAPLDRITLQQAVLSSVLPRQPTI